MNKKGFTLIELLAVIVILAIIALIATPIVLNIIEDSKDSSNERSIANYANAVEYAVARFQVENTTGKISGVFTTEDGKTLTGETTLIVDYDGDVVCDTIEVYNDGNIYLENCKVNGTLVDYTYGTKQETPICTFANVGTEGEIGAKYACEVKTGTIYNFYILSKNNDGTINLIMDQNINSDGTPAGTTNVSQEENASLYNTVAWQSSGEVEDGPVTAMEFLYNATKSWTNVPALNYTYNDKEFQGGEYGYTSFVSTNGVLTITSATEPVVTATIGTEEEPLRARMPIYTNNAINSSKNEVADKTDSNAYLYDNSAFSFLGYLTLSSAQHTLWFVDCEGVMYNQNYGTTAWQFVRPVITLKI